MLNEQSKGQALQGNDLSEQLLTDLSATANDLAVRAGELLLDYRLQVIGQAVGKKDVNDLVTAADQASEKQVVAGIRSAWPAHGIIGEEGSTLNSNSRIQWVIDPLDGTMNYVHGCGPFAVSIGIEFDGVPVAGVVHVPLTEETFSAVLGQGAHCNGVALTASDKADLATAMIGFDGSTAVAVRQRQSAIATSMLPKVRDLRRIGSCSISLCWVAAGRLDGFLQHDGGPWDISAGTVIAREAGAWVGSSHGDVPTTAETLAATPGIAAAFRQAVDAS